MNFDSKVWFNRSSITITASAHAYGHGHGSTKRNSIPFSSLVTTAGFNLGNGSSIANQLLQVQQASTQNTIENDDYEWERGTTVRQS